MPLKNITKLLDAACEKDFEDRLWQQWLVDYARMDNVNFKFMSFEDYKKECLKPPAPKVDAAQAIATAEEIKRLDQGGG